MSKKFFSRAWEASFLPAEYFMYILKEYYVYEKHSLTSKKSFDVFCGNLRHIQVDSSEERVTFVVFSKWYSTRAKVQFGTSKKLLSRTLEVSFVACRILSVKFEGILQYSYAKHSWRSKEIVWHSLWDHTTRRSRFAWGESEFARFFKKDPLKNVLGEVNFSAVFSW